MNTLLLPYLTGIIQEFADKKTDAEMEAFEKSLNVTKVSDDEPKWVGMLDNYVQSFPLTGYMKKNRFDTNHIDGEKCSTVAPPFKGEANTPNKKAAILLGMETKKELGAALSFNPATGILKHYKMQDPFIKLVYPSTSGYKTFVTKIDEHTLKTQTVKAEPKDTRVHSFIMEKIEKLVNEVTEILDELRKHNKGEDIHPEVLKIIKERNEKILFTATI